MTKKVLIAIVNSSSFGVSFPEHLRELETFADLIRVDIPNDAPASVFHEKLKDADGIIASVTPVYTREVLLGLPKLRLLARHGVGCDNVHLPTCTELGIGVSRVMPEVERESVAQYAIGLMEAAARKIVEGVDVVKAGQWAKRAKIALGVDFNQNTIGIVGIGAIGGTVSRILSCGFQANVIAYDPYLTADEIAARHAKKVELDELLTQSSIITLHCPLTSETSRMISAPQIAKTKKGVIFVNTCRGEIFTQADLIAALESGQVGGYATDVVEGEPIGADHILPKTKNVIVTPHLGGYSVVSLGGMGATMVSDHRAIFVEGGFPGRLANADLDLANSRMAKFRQ